MSSQTARRPNDKRTPPRSTKAKRYTRQTAHVEARRDGKPLVFGWGGHLSHNEKVKLQRRAVWGSIVLIALILVAVIVGAWVNVNIITPGLPITSVNGHNISQSDFRKMLAVKAQIAGDTLNGANGLLAQRDNLKAQVDAQQKIIDTTNTQITSLNKQIKALPAGNSAQRTALDSQLATAKTTLSAAQTKHDSLNGQYQNIVSASIPNQQQLYTQPQQENESAQWLQDDELIREWLATQSSAVQAQITPTTTAVNNAVKSFISNLPHGTSYGTFLSTNGISDTDVHAMFTVIQRRTNAQTYQASLVTSPTYQVLARSITSATVGDANNILKQLKSGTDFGKLAASKSVDNNTKAKGGNLGWLAHWQYTQTYAADSSGVVENWLFNPSRKINELSPVLSQNGSFYVVQILGIDPSRAVDSTTLQNLKNDALTAWLLSLRVGANITTVDQTKITDPSNNPSSLPVSAPTPQGGLPATGGGLPGGLPGGTTGGTVPGQ